MEEMMQCFVRFFTCVFDCYFWACINFLGGLSRRARALYIKHCLGKWRAVACRYDRCLNQDEAEDWSKRHQKKKTKKKKRNGKARSQIWNKIEFGGGLVCEDSHGHISDR